MLLRAGAIMPVPEAIGRGKDFAGGDLAVWIGAGAIGFGLAAMLGVAWWMLKAGGKQTDSGRDSRRAQASANEQQQAAELAMLLKELTAELDAKADRLERLLQQADRLEGRVKESRGASATSERAKPARAGSAGEAITGAIQGTDEFSRKVYQLADQGRSAVEIAQVLGSHIGKVELLLSLRGMRRGG